MYSVLMKYTKSDQFSVFYVKLVIIMQLSFCAAMGADFSISPTIFTGRAGNPAEIIATFRVDNIAQEINETAQVKITLTLGTFPPEAIFIDTIEFVIVDSDGKMICHKLFSTTHSPIDLTSMHVDYYLCMNLSKECR